MATSFLPFLYPARLVQRPPRGPVVRHFLRSLHATAPRPERRQPPPSLLSSSNSSSSNRRPAHRDPIPFELPPDIERDLLPDGEKEASDFEDLGALDDGGRISIGAGGPEGTITPLERQAFRRIFREISQRQQHTSGILQAEDSEYGVQDFGVGEYENDSNFLEAVRQRDDAQRQRARVNTILSEASDDQVLGREHQRNQWRQDEEESVAEAAAAVEGCILGALGSLGGATEAPSTALTDHKSSAKRNRVLAQFPPSLRSAAGKAMGIKDEARAKEGRQQLKHAEGTDTATPISTRTKTSPSLALEVCRKRQEKMELAMLSKKTDFALWEYMEDHVFALVDEFGIARDAKNAKVGGRPRKVSTKLTVYGPLYPALLLHGQRLLDSHFSGGKTSPLALAVLPRIKALGLASYVLGASTPLYNHLLRIRWARQGDAAAVFSLLQEMQRAGLAFDQATLDVVKSIEWHVVPLAGGRMGLATADRTTGGGEGQNAFAAAALRQLPDLATVAGMATYWRQQVERTVNWGRRG